MTNKLKLKTIEITKNVGYNLKSNIWMHNHNHLKAIILIIKLDIICSLQLNQLSIYVEY